MYIAPSKTTLVPQKYFNKLKTKKCINVEHKE